METEHWVGIAVLAVAVVGVMVGLVLAARYDDAAIERAKTRQALLAPRPALWDVTTTVTPISEIDVSPPDPDESWGVFVIDTETMATKTYGLYEEKAAAKRRAAIYLKENPTHKAFLQKFTQTFPKVDHAAQ